MRAPTPSFKGALAACRQRLESELKDHTKLAFALKILDRWSRQPALENTWATISPKLRVEYSAEDFILDVLASAHCAEKLKLVVDELDSRGPKTIARSKHFIKSKRFSEAADVLKLLAEVREGRQRLLSRKKKTAARNYFMTGWGEKFITLCGQPFDDIVIQLTEIALGDEVTMEMARGARKPTTSSGRRHKN
jgi:hypothetical protein